MKITFYQNSSERNRVDKTNYLTLIQEMNGTLRDESSVLNMIIDVESASFPNYNYCYIEEFNRYYYIESISSIRNGFWELTLSIDVLMTYKNGIVNLIGFVERSQSLYNDRLIDKKRVIEQGYDIEDNEINSQVFSNDTEAPEKSWRYIINGYKLGATASEV